MTPAAWRIFAIWLRREAATHQRLVISDHRAIELADLIDRHFDADQKAAA